MDLSVLHAVKSPERDYTMKDKLNGITSPLGCRFLEWSGWYNQNISQRLLGHYRLYQLLKTKSQLDPQLSLPMAYIAHYRTLHMFKYALSCITAVLYYIFTLGDRYHPLPVEQLNKQLIYLIIPRKGVQDSTGKEYRFSTAKDNKGPWNATVGLTASAF